MIRDLVVKEGELFFKSSFSVNPYFHLIEISKDYQDDFVCAKGNLSPILVNALVWIAGALRKSAEDELVWCNNNVWWFNDGKKYSLFVTDNQITMLKNWTEEKLYRVEFEEW